MAESWRLKLDRADKHLREFQIAIGEYVRRSPYDAVRVVGGGDCRKHVGYDCGGSWSLRITEQPDPMLAVVAGDVIHNVRSALDHIAVALAPRERRYKASFPIETRNIWAKKGRRYIDSDPQSRKRWRSSTQGMAPGAIAILKRLQPYQESTPDKAALALLSRLENADKHRQLTILTMGLTDITIWGTARGRTKELTIERPDHFVTEDGAELVHFGGRGGAFLRPYEVQVEIRGTPLVTTKVANLDLRRRQLGEYWPLGPFLEGLIADMRTSLVPALEPYVLPPGVI